MDFAVLVVGVLSALLSLLMLRAIAWWNEYGFWFVPANMFVLELVAVIVAWAHWWGVSNGGGGDRLAPRGFVESFCISQLVGMFLALLLFFLLLGKKPTRRQD